MISVVAVTYSPGESLTTFLDTLATASAGEIEVVLADNGSTDGSIEEAVRRPGVRWLDTGGNLGYGAAANLGVRAAPSGDWVVVANPDVEWTAGSLDRLLAATERWPRGGAFGPAILTAAGEVYPSARNLPTIRDGVGHALVGWVWAGNPWTVRYRAEDAAIGERTAGWLSGSCLLLRREAFEAIGGFDPTYFMYFEDLDLGRRLGLAGWDNVYVADAIVTHRRAHATSLYAAAMVTEHHRSAAQFLSRRYPGLRWLPVRAVLRGGLAVRALVARRLTRMAAGAGAQRRWPGRRPSQR